MPRIGEPKQLPSGKWAVRVTTGYEERDGRKRPIQRLRTFASYEDAAAALGSHWSTVSKVRAGTLRRGSEVLVRERFRTWIATREGRIADANRSHFDHHLLPLIGDRRLAEIDGDVIAELIATLREKKSSRTGQKTEKPLSRSTVKRILASLSKFLSDAGFPTRIRFKTQPAAYRWIRTTDEIAKVLGAAGEIAEWFRVACAIAVYGGLRAGEVASLRWSSIDFDRQVIAVISSHDRQVKTWEARHMRLAPELSAILKSWKLKSGEKTYVVRKPDGSPIVRERNDSLSPMVRRACKRAGVDPIGFHDWRHTWASHLSASGVPLQAIQAAGGWKSIAMVMRYSHLAPGSVARDPRFDLAFRAAKEVVGKTEET
ncbi:MAG: site-specific integrase [Armatimonadota bacterium]